MPQGEEHAPRSAAEQQEADRAAGWDVERHGAAPFEHGLPVAGLEATDTAPAVTEW